MPTEFLCWQSFIRFLYSIPYTVAGPTMELLDFCPWTGESLTSNLYWPSMTPRTENRCVSSVRVKFSKMFISSYGIILILFSRPFILLCEQMVWWVQVFLMYPPLEMVQ